MASGLVQLLLILLLFTSDALDFMLDLTSALALIPYLLAAGYALKLTITRETYEDRRSLVPDTVIAALATFYTLFLVYAAGLGPIFCPASCTPRAPSVLDGPPRTQSSAVHSRGGGAVRNHSAGSDRGRGVPGHRRHQI